MTRNPLPRLLAPGVWWLGACLEQLYQGRSLHGYNSTYLVCGEDASLLVEAGFPHDLPVVEAQLDGLLSGGAPPLRYVFTTHQETPHASGLGRLLARYPETTAIGDVRDFHLAFPQYEDRLRPLPAGESVDLGGTRFLAVEAVIRDLESTLWGFDERRRVLFPGDGFAYSHYHDDGHCGKVAEEAVSLDVPDMTALFADLALHWTRFADMTAYIERLDRLLSDELGVELIAPTHGLPITDIALTVPKVREGLLLGSAGVDG